ncbi:hypothetical protein AV530_002401 [Patagioenas fasciata monilis]|uniref:Uncharacterized protein n=1 Tax=Patagioenas fasciata monilis TaxID=372326 RepID=A0A1V4K679_PATFA|nr:hypothetical protein AV530_002401 [Patagioenas fasciata monilis]
MGFSMFTQFLFKLFELQMLFNMLEVPVKPSKKALRFTPVQTHPSKGLFPSGHLPPHLIREIQAPRLENSRETICRGRWAIVKRSQEQNREKGAAELQVSRRTEANTQDSERYLRKNRVRAGGSMRGDSHREFQFLFPVKTTFVKQLILVAPVFGVENPAIEKKACHKIKADKDNHNVLKMVDLG